MISSLEFAGCLIYFKSSGSFGANEQVNGSDSVACQFLF